MFYPIYDRKKLVDRIAFGFGNSFFKLSYFTKNMHGTIIRTGITCKKILL